MDEEVVCIFYQEANIRCSLTRETLIGTLLALGCEEEPAPVRVGLGGTDRLRGIRFTALSELGRMRDEVLNQRIGDRYIVIKVIEFDQNLFIAILKCVDQRRASQACNRGHRTGTAWGSGRASRLFIRGRGEERAYPARDGAEKAQDTSHYKDKSRDKTLLQTRETHEQEDYNPDNHQQDASRDSDWDRVPPDLPFHRIKQAFADSLLELLREIIPDALRYKAAREIPQTLMTCQQRLPDLCLLNERQA